MNKEIKYPKKIIKKKAKLTKKPCSTLEIIDSLEC